MSDNSPTEPRDLIEESRHIWDTNAQAWDARIGGGGGWQTILIAPTVERLLAVQPGRVYSFSRQEGVSLRIGLLHQQL